MKMTAKDLLGLGVIDRIVPEPVGGAQRDPAAAVASLTQALGEELDALAKLSPDSVRRAREDRFLAIG
jgi:acetyl-CoA carboxylase carboxyl transferase subunit alpha